MIRKLGVFERAMLIANKHAPFNIVCVLRIENAPSPDILKGSLEALQERQPFLQARIIEEGKSPYFEVLATPELPFQLINRTDKNQWEDIAEKEMAFRYDQNTKSLFRLIYIYSENASEIILNVHHAIMDAVSGMNLLDELLRLCEGDGTALPSLQPAPIMESRFPPSYKGVQRVFNTTRYAVMQMGDMARTIWRTRNKRVPPVRLGGRGHITTLILPEHLVNSLSRHGRKKGLTLNSLLNAALVLAINRHLYDSQNISMRTFAFADLRPYTQPPTSPELLGNYISMMGYTADVFWSMDFWDLAKDIHTKIYRSLKQGDKFNAALMSESLLKMFTKIKRIRFGATALNYSGNVPLKTQYGDIKLVGLHGFVSGYDLGPEFSSQARLFNNEIWWDFIYLDTDMDADLAGKIVAEIKLILEKASRNHD